MRGSDSKNDGAGESDKSADRGAYRVRKWKNPNEPPCRIGRDNLLGGIGEVLRCDENERGLVAWTSGKAGPMNELLKQYAKERDKAFEDVVLHDDLLGLREFCAKWRIPMSKKENVQRAAVYKAVQECTNISEEVKQLAREKCVNLGFKPTMD